VRRVLTTGGRVLTVLAAAVLLAALSGCSTDDDVGGLVPSCITFIPVKDPTPGEVTSVWGSESTCERAEVELVVSGVDNIWSAEFEVHYPVGISQFAAVDAGDSFLLEGIGTLLVEAQEITAGVIEIGVSRVDSQNNIGVTPTTNTLLVRLFFERFTSSGSGDVTLVDANLTKVENLGDAPTPFAPAIEFSGGEIFIEN
jgi:hypothetical protein